MAQETAPVDLYYADHTDPAVWPVADQVRRWDKSDRINLHPVSDCSVASGPCVTIGAHDRLPTWWDSAGYGMGEPIGVTWLRSHIDADGTYRPELTDGTVWLTTTEDGLWAEQGALATMHAGLVCHELGHWLTQKGNEMHQFSFGCLSDINNPYPGKRARALIPSWRYT
jgi:hypothetical protein